MFIFLQPYLTSDTPDRESESQTLFNPMDYTVHGIL